MKRLTRLTALLMSILMLVGLTACKSGDGKEKQNNITLDDALVNTGKAMGEWAAEMGKSGALDSRMSDEELIAIGENYASFLSSGITDALLYKFDADDVTDGQSGELPSAGAFTTPHNVSFGNNFMVTASMMSASAIYPLPKDFEGYQLLELRYKTSVSLIVSFRATAQNTLEVASGVLYTQDHEKPFDLDSALMSVCGKAVAYETVKCALDTDATLADFESVSDPVALNDRDDALALAKKVAKEVSLKASEEYLESRGLRQTAGLLELCTACDILNGKPSYALILPLTDAEGVLDSMNIYDSVLNMELYDRKTTSEQTLADLCTTLLQSAENIEYVGCAAAMATDRSYQTDRAVQPMLIWLLYEQDGERMVCSVSIIANDSGCVRVSTDPLWTTSPAVDAFDYHLDPQSHEWSDSEGDAIVDWLKSAELIELQ